MQAAAKGTYSCRGADGFMAHYVAENPADLTKHRANLAVDPDFPKPLLQD